MPKDEQLVDKEIQENMYEDVVAFREREEL